MKRGAMKGFFIALPDGFLCGECNEKRPPKTRLDPSLDSTEVWEEYSAGWTDSCVCVDCKLSIPVYTTNDNYSPKLARRKRIRSEMINARKAESKALEAYTTAKAKVNALATKLDRLEKDDA